MVLLVLALAAGCSTERRPDPSSRAPEFPSRDAERWLGGPPTTITALRGSVVLVEAWSLH